MTAQELITRVLEIEEKGYAPRGHWRELGETAPALARMLKLAIEQRDHVLVQGAQDAGWLYSAGQVVGARVQLANAELDRLAGEKGE